jgi:hypothetical protein
MKRTLTVAVLVCAAATAGAQVIQHDAQSKSEQHQLQLKIEQARASGVHVSVEPRAVTGMPYSGEAVTESIQVLADGNRIVKRTTAKVYRDGTGRTRRETIGADGEVTTVMINNPKTGMSVAFDPGTNTAHKTTAVTVLGKSAGTTVGSYYTISDGEEAGAKAHARIVTGTSVDKQKQEHEAQLKHTQGLATTIESTVTTSGPVTVVSHNTFTGPTPTKEELGIQSFDGVPAKGTRTKTVIPAGAIGNEQAITIVSEEWYSTDLQVLLMTKHSDPRSGDTTYRLTNLVRSEPDPSLFELPAGHTIK